MVAEGADIIDVGAESTRPYGGMAPISADEEQARLMPVLPAVIALGKPVSIDTMKAEVADWAIRQGAAIANDVWGLQRDPDMARVVARHGVPVIVMHNRDEADPSIDIVADVMAFFERSLVIAEKAGIRREQIVLDPGIGFGKTPEQSIVTIAHLRRLQALRPEAADGTFAQALHRLGHARAARSAARRLDRRHAAVGRGRRRHRARA